MEKSELKGFFRWLDQSKRGREENHKREKRKAKGNQKKGRKEGERRRSCKSSIVASLEDPNLIPHTTRGEGSFLFGYFLVWGHGNGIWLSLLCDCLNEKHAGIVMLSMLNFLGLRLNL